MDRNDKNNIRTHVSADAVCRVIRSSEPGNYQANMG